MKSALVFPVFLLTGALLAHEQTRRAFEASLDPRAARRLLAAAALRTPAPAASAVAEMCQLTLRLFDVETSRPRIGLVRVTKSDGAVETLPGLINRARPLRSLGEQWYV